MHMHVPEELMDIVYGVFTARDKAEAAQAKIHEIVEVGELDNEAILAAEMYEDEEHVAELPRAGVFAWGWPVLGRLVIGATVGVLIGLLAAGVLVGLQIVNPTTTTAVLVIALAAVIGAVLAALAGSLIRRFRLHKLERELASGRVVFMLEAPRARIAALVDALARQGAVRAGSL